MPLVLRVTASLLVVVLLFLGMITAFHLLNLPSNLAVLAGVCLLLALPAGGFVVFRALWTVRGRAFKKGRPANVQ